MPIIDGTLKFPIREIPYCEKCEIFMTLNDLELPQKGWHCPKCGYAKTLKQPETTDEGGKK